MVAATLVGFLLPVAGVDGVIPPVFDLTTFPAPTPYESFLGALGGCTIATLRLYSNIKGWDLGEVTCEVSHRRIKLADCPKPTDRKPDKRGMVDYIEVTTSFTGELTAQQRERLDDIANRCPVHRSIDHGVVAVELK